MAQTHRSALLLQVCSCWNWKCALLSAIVRSFIYLLAMVHSRHADRRAVILVEIAYVALTSGIYAALQQRALRLRSRILGDSIVVLGVPALAQLMDWTAHRVTSTAVSGRGMATVCLFAAISALFHLHVMRNGVFLSGFGRSLADDFRAIPKLLVEFVSRPYVFLTTWIARPFKVLESDGAL